MEKTVIIETSARHVHLTRRDLDKLFGKGHELTWKKDLSQPGQYACEERVAVVGPRGEFPAVSILGPLRPATQVEITITDAKKLGFFAPIRESGQIAGSPGCKLIGPYGEVDIPEGVIVAKRHIHATPADAKRYGLRDKQIVRVQYDCPERSVIYGDVVVRVHENFSLAMHVDVDESNAGTVSRTAEGVILD